MSHSFEFNDSWAKILMSCQSTAKWVAGQTHRPTEWQIPWQQTDRQHDRDRLIDRPTNRQTEIAPAKWTDRLTDRPTDRQTDRQPESCHLLKVRFYFPSHFFLQTSHLLIHTHFFHVNSIVLRAQTQGTLVPLVCVLNSLYSAVYMVYAWHFREV